MTSCERIYRSKQEVVLFFLNKQIEKMDIFILNEASIKLSHILSNAWLYCCGKTSISMVIFTKVIKSFEKHSTSPSPSFKFLHSNERYGSSEYSMMATNMSLGFS